MSMQGAQYFVDGNYVYLKKCDAYANIGGNAPFMMHAEGDEFENKKNNRRIKSC